jgi:hypothetical protein
MPMAATSNPAALDIPDLSPSLERRGRSSVWVRRRGGSSPEVQAGATPEPRWRAAGVESIVSVRRLAVAAVPNLAAVAASSPLREAASNSAVAVAASNPAAAVASIRHWTVSRGLAQPNDLSRARARAVCRPPCQLRGDRTLAMSGLSGAASSPRPGLDLALTQVSVAGIGGGSVRLPRTATAG